MKKQKWLSFLLLMLLVFIMTTGSINTFAAFPGTKEASEYNLDFSFLNLDPKTNSEEYSAGADKFLKDSYEIMGCLLEGYRIGDNVDTYYTYAEKLQLPKINEYLDQDKYFDPLASYLENAENNYKLISYYEYMCEFEEEYKKEYTSEIAKKIDAIIAEAASKGGSGIAQSVDLYKKAIKACDAVLLNVPDFQAVKDKKSEIQKLLEKAGGSVDSSVYASAIHKQNVGKILFSKVPVAIGNETENQYVKSFAAGENIYATAYLPFKVKGSEIKQIYDETFIGYETVTLDCKYYVDGRKDCYLPVVIAMNAQDYQEGKSYVTFDLMPNPATAVGYNQTGWFKYLFSTLTPAKHKITIELTHVVLGKIAEGTFEIDWTKADATKLEKDVELASKNATAYRANLRKMPLEFTEKHTSFSDESISDEKIKELFLRKYPDVVKIIKLVNIGSSTGSWIIEKDEYEYPTGKRATMETWLMYQDKDGWYRFTKFWLYCEYAGFGIYNDPTITYEMQHTKISPKNVN